MIPRHVWVEMCDDAEHEACDVIVEMDWSVGEVLDHLEESVAGAR